MKYILSIFLALLLFSCSNQDEKPKSDIQGLFNAGDTISVETFGVNSVSRLVTPEPGTQWALLNEKGDTVVLTFRSELRTYAYYVPVIDTVIKPKRTTAPPTTDPPKEDPPAGSYGTLIHSSGFDKSTDINIYQGPQNSISTSVFKTGPGSFKSQAGTSASSQSSGYRGEMQYTQAQTPVEGVYEYDVYYENWRSFSGGGHSVQWHPDNSSGSAVISLQNYGGLFNVVRSLSGVNTHQSGTLLKVEPNRWYNMRWEVKFSTGNDGYIRLHIDNKLYYSFTGRTTSGGQYFKLGQNRWNTGGVNSVVYYDNLKIWKR